MQSWMKQLRNTSEMTAIDDTLTGRDETHGDFVDQADDAQRMLEVINTREGWKHMPSWMRFAIQMILMKIARIVHGDCRSTDHWHDIQGYSLVSRRSMVC